MKEVYEKLHDLSEFVNPETFKSHEDLQSRLDKVLGNVSQASNKKLDPELQEEMDEEYEEVTSKKSSKVISRDDDDDDEDADDALNYFERLASMWWTTAKLKISRFYGTLIKKVKGSFDPFF